MDDSSDGPGSISDSLNGESKPDPAKLAQTAIIKQVRFYVLVRFLFC